MATARGGALTVRRAVAVALVGATVLAVVAVGGLRVDNRLERWVGADAVERDRYRAFRDEFGSDEFVVVAIGGEALLSVEALDAMVDAADRLEAVPGVAGVEGLPVVFRDLFGGEDPEALEEEATSTPFYRGLFLSDDGADLALLAEVTPPGDPQARHRIVAGIREAVAPLVERGLTVDLVGSTILADALDEVSRREAGRTFPIALVASLTVLAMLLRSLRAMAVAALCSAVTVVLTLGLMAATGHQLDMVSSALPSLLWVLALANAIHLLQRYQRLRERLPVDDAVAGALAEAARPCTLAALTTAAGFLSLLVAEVAPVREVGAFAAVGLVLSLPVNLALGPELTRLMRVPGRASGARAGARRSIAAVLRRPRTVIAGAALLTAAAAAAVPHIRVESNPLSFLPEGHEVSSSYRSVGQRIAGFYSLELVLELGSRWTEPASWSTIDALADRISASPVVTKVVSPLDLLRKLRQWRQGFDPQAYALPVSRAEAEELLAGLDARGRQALAALVASDGRTVRLSAVVNEMDNGRFLELVATARRAVAELGEGARGWVTGMVLRLVEAQRHLVVSQVRSLGLAAAVIFVAILLGLRSWRLTLISVPPNLLPALVTFAVMAVTRIPLDAATVMVASVALGIAVDNTIHLLAGYDRERRGGADPQAAVRTAAERVGSALIITSVTAAIGFFSLCFSAFVPIRDFGLLAGLTMLVALAADLLLVPALLVARSER